MSNRANGRNQRYSRPPSLSTISSNEESDFSTNRQNRQTWKSTYSVSPLVEYQPAFYNPPPPPPPQSLPPKQRPVQSFNNRAVPLYSTTEQRQHHLADQDRNEHRIGVLDPGKHSSNSGLEKPRSAFTKPNIFILPTMERSDTDLSDDSAQVDEPTVKYMKTRYMWMLLQLDQIPWWHNLLAALAAWVILAAYLVLPGTFASFKPSDTPTNTPQGQIDAAFATVVNGVNNLGLLIFSGILAGAGGLVCVVLVFLHWENYVWLSWKIFQPMALNALAGLVSTIVNVQTAQKGVWSITAKINASVTGSVVAIAGGFFILYNFWLLKGVKDQHRKHFPVDAELVDPVKQNRFNRKVGKYLPNKQGYSY